MQWDGGGGVVGTTQLGKYVHMSIKSFYMSLELSYADLDLLQIFYQSKLDFRLFEFLVVYNGCLWRIISFDTPLFSIHCKDMKSSYLLKPF